MIKSIYLTHKKTLGFDLSITGGVQLCSQEFFHLLTKCGFDLEPYYVDYTKKIASRVFIKLNLDCYSAFDVKKYAPSISNYIKTNKIEFIFINHASAIRFAKPIKEAFGEEVKIFLLSHGNDSGDFLHVTTKPITKYNLFTKYRDLYRLGRLIHNESVYRIKYLDGVLTVSSVEEQIEKWLGAKNVLFTPRTINKSYNLNLNTNYRKVGFIGRLDHPPNYHGVTLLCDELLKIQIKPNLEMALIGAPSHIGEEFQKKYPFVSYKGELADDQLEAEISSWAIFLNPVFWYSMGVTTKIAKAIEWGVPIITTHAGIRGYSWKNGSMIEVRSPKEMAKEILQTIYDTFKIEKFKTEMRKIKESSYSIDELASSVSSFFKQLKEKENLAK